MCPPYVLNIYSRIQYIFTYSRGATLCNHKNVNDIFRLVNPALDMDTYIFKETLFLEQAKYEKNTVFFSSFRVFNL